MRSFVCFSFLLVGVVGCGDSSADGEGGSASTSSTKATTSSQSGPTTSSTSATTNSATSTTQASSATGGPMCTQARLEALGPIDMVSEGEVTVLADAGGVATLFIDATAGGLPMMANNPWTYVSFSNKARVDVTDVSADASTAWDLALKRPIMRANTGDGGPAGSGGSFRLAKEFDTVTAADLAAVVYENEIWFDEECMLFTDPTGSIATSFDGWYDYDNMVVTPGAGTWLVRSGDGTRFFKLAVESYYSTPQGGEGAAGGRYRMRVAELVP